MERKTRQVIYGKLVMFDSFNWREKQDRLYMVNLYMFDSFNWREKWREKQDRLYMVNLIPLIGEKNKTCTCLIPLIREKIDRLQWN